MQVPFSPYGFLILSGKKSNTSGEGQLAQLSLLPITTFMYDLLKPLGVQFPSIGEDLPSVSVCPSFQAMNFFWDKDLLSPLSLSTTSNHSDPTQPFAQTNMYFRKNSSKARDLKWLTATHTGHRDTQMWVFTLRAAQEIAPRLPTPLMSG